MDQDAALRQAIDRLAAFRASWNPGDLVDEGSGLTADDLDQVIASARRGVDMVPIQMVDFSKPIPPGTFDQDR